MNGEKESIISQQATNFYWFYWTFLLYAIYRFENNFLLYYKIFDTQLNNYYLLINYIVLNSLKMSEPRKSLSDDPDDDSSDDERSYETVEERRKN